MKKILKIGIDFDGVIADSTNLKIKTAKKMYNVDILAKRFKEYMVVADKLLTQPQYRELMNAVCTTKIGLEMEMIAGARLALIKIQKEHQIYIVTSREEHEILIAKQWCKKNDLNLEFISIGYGKSKMPIVKDFDIFIDDDLPKLEPLLGIVPSLFLFNQSHNEDKQIPVGIQRIFSWEEFLNELNKINEK